MAVNFHKTGTSDIFGVYKADDHFKLGIFWSGESISIPTLSKKTFTGLL